MKPRPNAAPSMPYACAILRVRSHPRYARAVVMFPPDRPSMMREKQHVSELATASITKLSTVPSRLKMRTGRGPTGRRARPGRSRDELGKREDRGTAAQ